LLLVALECRAQANAQQAQAPNTQVYYRLTTKWCGDDMSLDVVNDSKANNQLILAKTGNFSGQLWKLTPTNVKVEGPASGPAQASITGHEVVRVSKQVNLAPGAFDTLTVRCPEGKKVFGGGSGPSRSVRWPLSLSPPA
jgi:hypothetical protein